MKGAGTLDDPLVVKHGEKIDRPGVYDCPIGWYHDDCCLGPSISSSGIRTILSATPKAYWHGSPLNPKRGETAEASPAMRLGSAAHVLLLEPHRFRSTYEVRPDRFDSWRTKDSQRYRATRAIEGVTVLDPKEMDAILGVAAALGEHPLRDVLAGYVERSLFWIDEETGIWLKSRPDAIPASGNIYGDLKCVADPSPEAVRRSVWDRGYHVQMALAEIGIETLLSRSMEIYTLVAVGSKASHDILFSPLDAEAIGWGKRLVRKRPADLQAMLG